MFYNSSDQIGAMAAFAVVTIVAVSFHAKRSELIQKDDYYLGPLWRTKSDSENILGSLALTGHVGEATKVVQITFNAEMGWNV